MKENIEINEYVRTERGVIYKYTEEEREDIMLQDFRLFNDGKVIKHSPNIIDLIEEGDYVNGEIVIDIGERGLYLGYADDNEHYSRIFIDESEIKSIVTKEQFNQVKYEV